MNGVAAAGIIAAIVSWIVSAWVVGNAKKLKVVDDPAVRKEIKNTHVRPVPRGGGIPIWAAVTITAAIFIPQNNLKYGVIATTFLLAVVGYLDDRNPKGVSPYGRLIINVIVGGIIFVSGWAIRYASNPFGGIILFGEGVAFLMTVLWLTWMQNVVGWSSGVDGQLPGFVVIAAIAIAIMSRQENNLAALILAAITAGAYLGFLPWNFFPQKIMPGYGGKSMAGLLLGLVAMLSVARVGAMAMVLGLPFVDAFWVILKRISEGRSPVWGGREHLHHYLLDIGWSKRKISLFYWLVSAILAVAAIQLKATAWYFTMAAVVLVISGVILWVKSLSEYSKQPGPDSG